MKVMKISLYESYDDKEVSKNVLEGDSLEEIVLKDIKSDYDEDDDIFKIKSLSKMKKFLSDNCPTDLIVDKTIGTVVLFGEEERVIYTKI